MTDRQLRQLIKMSPQKAHRALFDEYCNYVYVIVLNVLKSCSTREDIEECVSDVFAKLFRLCESCPDSGGDMKGLIGKVARNTAIDFFRRLSSTYGRSVSIEDESLRELCGDTSVEDEADRSERRFIMLKKIKELGEPDSSIIIHQYFYGRTAKETGALLSMTAGAVQKRSSRAKQKLKTMLIEAGIGKEELQ